MTTDAKITPTRYSVSMLPIDHREHGHFEITVEWRGDGRWAVMHMGYCLGTDGDWEYESIPSERRDEWLATHRFDLDTALRLAKEAAPKVTVNGWTVERVLRDEAGKS